MCVKSPHRRQSPRDNNLHLLPLNYVCPVHISLHTPKPHGEIAALEADQGRPAQFATKELDSSAQ